MQPPDYDLNKIKFTTDESTFEKAVALYESGKVTQVEEGCNRLSALVSELPVGIVTAQLLVDLLLRLDQKLQTSGVDDSDGIVGGFIEEVVTVLKDYARLDPECIKAFSKLKGKETCFGWEEPLLKLTVTTH